MSKTPKKNLRPDEAAGELGVSRRTIYRLISAGEFLAFAVRPGGAVRIPRESLDAYISRRIDQYQQENGIFVPPDDTD